MPNNVSLQQQYSINDDQLQAVEFLAQYKNGTTTNGVSEETDLIITTHCAHIVLNGNCAYKIKRSIKYSYLNMLQLDERERLCKRELAINKPGLPNIYREVLPITMNKNGALSLNGDGDIVEWVLVMERFSQHRVLDAMAKDGSLSLEIAKQVGISVAKYHAKLPAHDTTDGYGRMAEIVDELIEELGQPKLNFNKTSLNKFAQQGKSVVKEQEALLNRRAENGYVKRCHGDLHLRNIVLMGDGPHPFDALEFDERLATTDVLYDLAFVLMDLDHRGLASQQNTLLNHYLVQCKPEDFEGLALLPLFLFIRASIRAMTTAQIADEASKPPKDAVDYLELAFSYLEPRSPAMIAIGGYSGSGKSTIAAKISVQQNAILLSSDRERKAHLNVRDTQHLPPGSYTPKSARLNYQRLIDKTLYALSADQKVVVDATFLSTEQRIHIESIAAKAGVPFLGIWLDVPTEILESRIHNRRNNASDATVDVLHKQLENPVSEFNWKVVNACDSLDSTMTRIEALLRG